MSSFYEYTLTQYAYITDSRKALFDYCKNISDEHFSKQNHYFGNGGSIRSVLVHIANTYESWIAMKSLHKTIVFSTCEAHTSIDDIIVLFNRIDEYVQEFIKQYDQPTDEISLEYNTSFTVKAFKLFTHVTTHEFHHKGQILSLSRHWGYTPVDTDVMR